MVVVRVGQQPSVEMVSTELADLQRLVGEGVAHGRDSFVEQVFFEDELHIWVNENGIAEQLPFNFWWKGHVLLGTVLVSNADGATGEEVGLSEDEARGVVSLLRVLRDRAVLSARINGLRDELSVLEAKHRRACVANDGEAKARARAEWGVLRDERCACLEAFFQIASRR